MEKILEIKGLKKQGILNGIDFTIQQGDMAAIMGPSGSGKSTFLYQISGMDRADGGEIWYRDMELGQMTERERAAFRLRESGFVFQQMNMLKGLTIKENILLPAYHLYKGKKERKEANERAEGLMKKLGIETLSERRITEVSGGQLQRACICRSMINHPGILFADEPTGALNQGAAKEVMDAFCRLNEEGTTILLVTHDSRVAGRCGRICYLLDGQIRGEYTVKKGRRKEEQVKDWLSEMGW